MPLLAALVVMATYANGLDVGFHFDDWHVIEKNPAIRSPANVARFFVDPDASTALPENRTLRPLLLLSFALNHVVSGIEPWSYHAVNILLHWLVVVLVFRVVRDHLWLGAAAMPIAAGAALIVATHPLNTSAVDYVSARSAILATLFYLAAFDAVARNRRRRALVFCALCMLTKEIGVTLPLVALAYWAVERRRPDWSLFGMLAVVVVAGLAWRALLLPPTVLATMHGDVSPWQYWMTGWSAYLYYLGLFVWPTRLVIDRLDYPFVQSLADHRAWVSLVVLVVAGTLAWRARLRTPALTFAAAWFFITLAAESTLFPLAEAVNEHRPYLAMLGLGTAAALVLWRATALAARLLGTEPAATYATALAGVVVLGGSLSWQRTNVWRSDYELWLDATRKAPGNVRAWTNAGLAATTLGRLDEARGLLEEARRLFPCYLYALINTSALERRAGRDTGALEWADRAVRCHPTSALAHFYRGAALAALGRHEEALGAWRQTTTFDPRHVEAWLEQARALERNAEWADAAAAYDRVVALDPQNTEAAVGGGVLYQYRLGRADVALERFRGALRAVPTHYGAQYQAAVALLALGRTDEAFRAWRAFVPRALQSDDHVTLAAAPEAFRLEVEAGRTP